MMLRAVLASGLLEGRIACRVGLRSLSNTITDAARARNSDPNAVYLVCGADTDIGRACVSQLLQRTQGIVIAASDHQRTRDEAKTCERLVERDRQRRGLDKPKSLDELYALWRGLSRRERIDMAYTRREPLDAAPAPSEGRQAHRLTLDPTDDASIAHAAQVLRQSSTSDTLDVIINCIPAHSNRDAEIDRDLLTGILSTKVIGSYALASRMSHTASVVLNISSNGGFVGDDMTDASLAVITRHLASKFKPIIVAAHIYLNSTPMCMHVNDYIAIAVGRILNTMDRLESSDSGGILRIHGLRDSLERI